MDVPIFGQDNLKPVQGEPIEIAVRRGDEEVRYLLTPCGSAHSDGSGHKVFYTSRDGQRNSQPLAFTAIAKMIKQDVMKT